CWSRPLLAKSPCRIRAEHANHEIDQEPDRGDLQREHWKADEQADESRQNTKNESQSDQAEHGEQPDHENCAEHRRISQTLKRATFTERSYAAPLARVSPSILACPGFAR